MDDEARSISHIRDRDLEPSAADEGDDSPRRSSSSQPSGPGRDGGRQELHAAHSPHSQHGPASQSLYSTSGPTQVLADWDFCDWDDGAGPRALVGTMAMDEEWGLISAS
jgi:hypothetical protein